MSLLMALALSIGVLIAAWTFIALGSLALPVWAGIIAWGAFFAAGGKGDGLLKTIASTLSGVFWAFIALTLNARFGGGNAAVLPILVGAAAFVMVAQSKVSLLSFIPGAFLGAATAVGVVVGSNSTWSKVISLPASASTRSTVTTEPGPTFTCRPPVLMIANTFQPSADRPSRSFCLCAKELG